LKQAVLLSWSAALFHMARKFALPLHSIAQKLRGVSPRFVVAYVTAFLFFNHQKRGMTGEFVAEIKL
jgi:hypothetical protein